MNNTTPTPPQPKLLDQLRREIRMRHYSIRTERSYVDWVHRYILFHNKRHPAEMGASEVSLPSVSNGPSNTVPPQSSISPSPKATPLSLFKRFGLAALWLFAFFSGGEQP